MHQRGITSEEIEQSPNHGWNATDVKPSTAKVFHRGQRMRIEYDSVRDLLYIWFSLPGKKAAKTETVAPGVHTDFNRQGQLIGIATKGGEMEDIPESGLG